MQTAWFRNFDRNWPQIKIEYDRKGCIGAGACEAVNPENFEVEENGKAKLLGGKLNEQTQMFEKVADVEGEGFDMLKLAADGCPRAVIHLKNLDTGEKII